MTVRLSVHLASFVVSFAACAALAGTQGGGQRVPDRAVDRVTAARAFETVDHLSSPEFKGRLTGTAGHEAAARWMAEQCRRAGLKPPSGFPGYLQPFPVPTGGLESARLEVLPEADGAKPEVQEFFKGFMPMLQSAPGDVTAEVVFAGFGMTAPDMGRDDYAGVKAEGKLVMLIRGEPKDGRDWKAHNTTSAREANAKAHGAVGFLMVDQPVLSASGSPVEGLPAAEISEDLANQLLSGQKLKVEELRKLLEKGGTVAFPTGRKVHFTVVAKERREGQGYNVVAVLPGGDKSLAGEYLVVGAHLDHVGDWPVLFPGADDNASGSATLLEVARAMASVGERPRRTVVFVWFGGEEMGLLGARKFASDPPQGMTRCLAVFNLDMTGVGAGAYVSGGKNFPEIFQALQDARDRYEPGLKLVAGESKGEARADHGPFQEAGIHAVSLFGSGGSHHGYHTPEDTIYFITPKNMEALGRIVLGAAWSLADAR
jgi:hypothetical protein